MIKKYHYEVFAAASCFILLFFEFGLAHLSLEKIGILSRLTPVFESIIPSIRFAETVQAKVYMAITLIFTPIKIWGAYSICENFYDVIPLPSKENKISLRMIVCLISLPVFFGYIIYFTFFTGIAKFPHHEFLYENYSKYEIWYGWAFYRLTAFSLFVAINFATLRSYFVYIFTKESCDGK